MRNRKLTLKSLLVVASVAVAGASCAPLGGLGDVLGGTGDSLYGEVRAVDSRRIQLREQSGRDYTVRYDNRTRVIDGQRQYPVSSLERGDEVLVRVEYDRNNTLWADRIEVRRSARGSDRGDVWSASRVQRIDGRVDRIDARRGYFTLDGSSRSSIVVYVNRDTRREDIRRFERLRRGDRVRVEVRPRSGNQADLVRFR